MWHIQYRLWGQQVNKLSASYLLFLIMTWCFFLQAGLLQGTWVVSTRQPYSHILQFFSDCNTYAVYSSTDSLVNLKSFRNFFLKNRKWRHKFHVHFWFDYIMLKSSPRAFLWSKSHFSTTNSRGARAIQSLTFNTASSDHDLYMWRPL